MSVLIQIVSILLRQISDGIGEVWILGILPVYLLVYILIGVIAMRYLSSSAFTKDIRSMRQRSAMETLREGLRHFFGLAGVFTAAAVVFPPFLVLNVRHNAILTTLQENVGTLCSMVIGLTTIVLTVSVVIILFHKNYYLVFTISDVLKSYHFTECLGALLSNCLGTCVCALIQLYLTAGTLWYSVVLMIMEWCILICLAATGMSFWIIYRVMFSNEKAELRLLNRLYRIFRGGSRPDEVQASRAQDWDAGAVRMNVEYLCGEYVAAARTLPIHRVRSLRYLSGQARTETWNTLYKKILRTFIFAAICVWLFSMIVVSVVLGAEGTGMLLLDTIMLAVVTVPAWLGMHHGSGKGQTLFDDTLGYEMETEGGKRIRIPRMILRPANRYDRFVMRMNSLTAFFCIALERGMSADMTQAALQIVIDWLSDIREKHSCLYLPVFAAGYYAFAAGQRPQAVQNCYADLISRAGSEAEMPEQESGGARILSPAEVHSRKEKISGTEPEVFAEMLRGHLEDLVREVPPAGTDAHADAEAYLAWLREPAAAEGARCGHA